LVDGVLPEKMASTRGNQVAQELAVRAGDAGSRQTEIGTLARSLTAIKF